MEARGLQDGFRIGAWLVEPCELRVSAGGETFAVPFEHMQVLLCLVEKKGEFVDRRTLRYRVYADTPRGDRKLREAISGLHAVFGDTPRHPRHIAAAGRDGYSLIAHFEPVAQQPIAAPPMAAGSRRTDASNTKWTLVGRIHRLLAELRRRSVFRVAASYLVVMWILLQVAEVTFAPLHFPDWWIAALTILAVVGMPIVIMLAWTYEITPDGLVRDAEDVAEAILFSRTRRALTPAIIAGAILMAVVTGYAWLGSLGG